MVKMFIHCLWTQKRNVFAGNLTTCPQFWPPMSFRIRKEARDLFGLRLAKRCYCSGKVGLGKKKQMVRELSQMTIIHNTGKRVLQCKVQIWVQKLRGGGGVHDQQLGKQTYLKNRFFCKYHAAWLIRRLSFHRMVFHLHEDK